MSSLNTVDNDKIALLEYFINNLENICTYYNQLKEPSKIMMEQFVYEYYDQENKIAVLFHSMEEFRNSNEKIGNLCCQMEEIWRLRRENWTEEMWDKYNEFANEYDSIEIKEQRNYFENGKQSFIFKEFKDFELRKFSSTSTNEDSFILQKINDEVEETIPSQFITLNRKKPKCADCVIF